MELGASAPNLRQGAMKDYDFDIGVLLNETVHAHLKVSRREVYGVLRCAIRACKLAVIPGSP